MKAVLNKIDKIRNKKILIKIQEIILNELNKGYHEDGANVASQSDISKEPIGVINNGYVYEKYGEYQQMVRYANQFIMFNRYGNYQDNTKQKKKTAQSRR